MKRFRIKLAGFGCAVLAGAAAASDGEWQPLGKPAPPARVIPVGGAPALLPVDVRFGPQARPDPEPPPLWFPAATRPDPAAVVPAQHPEFTPIPAVPAVPAAPAVRPPMPAPTEWPPRGPRVGAVPSSPQDSPVLSPPTPLPPPMLKVEPPVVIPPVVTPPLPVPAAPAAPVAQPPKTDPLPKVEPPGGEVPPPRPIDPGAPWTPVQPKKMKDPTPPPIDFLPSTPPELPTPRPVKPEKPVKPEGPRPAGGELPVAPPELMVPRGEPVPGKHGVFGSPPISLSRDYPTLADLHGGSSHGWGRDPDAAPRGYVQAEYLLWWMSGLDIPVLAITSTTGTPGFLGQPGVVPILGPGEFVGPFRDGFRVRGGWWVDDCGKCGIDGSFFFLGRRTEETVLSPGAYPIITRPVFSPNPRNGGGVIGETGEDVAVPGVLNGTLTAQAQSFLYGFDANVRKCLATTCNSRATWFAGFRNVNLEESLSVTEDITVIGRRGDGFGQDPIGTNVVVRDKFSTENSFYGGQVGLTYERRWGRVSLDVRGSVALGVTHQELDIEGFQVRMPPNTPAMAFGGGGLLAAGPNIGTFTRNYFSVVPEITANVGYWITPRFRAYMGYNFMYWTNVIRPGDQIDRVVDLTFVPNGPQATPSGQLRPRAPFKQSDLLVTGLQLGMEFRW